VAEFAGISTQEKFFVSKAVFFHSSSFLPLSVNISFSFKNGGGEGNVFLPSRMRVIHSIILIGKKCL